MKPFYSIREIADLLDENVSAVCNCLIACGINSHFSGKKVNLQEHDSFFPWHSGQTFILIGGPPSPDPSNTFVITTELPELWIQSIKSHEGDDDTAIEGQDELPDTPENTVLPAPVVTPADDWVANAWRLANEIALKKWHRGEQLISARSICEPVAVELGKGTPDNPRKWWGTQGIRSGGAIRTALKGWQFTPPNSGTNGIIGTE